MIERIERRAGASDTGTGEAAPPLGVLSGAVRGGRRAQLAVD